MIRLSIDPGSIVTGWAISENNILTDYGKIDVVATIKELEGLKSKDKVQMSKRLAELMRSINFLITKYEPTTMVIESQFVGKNANTSMITARAMGVAVATGSSRGLDIIQYAPSEIKLAVTGKGNAKKEEVAEIIAIKHPRVLKELGEFKTTTKMKNDDIYDAIAIDMTHALVNGGERI